MKKLNTLLVTLSAIALVAISATTSSCGGGKRPSVNCDTIVMLKPYDPSIKGYLSDVLQIADGEYKFDYKANSDACKGTIQVKIKSIGKSSPNDYGLRDGNNGPLYLSICDENGMPLENFTDMASDYGADGLLKDMVTKIGEENWIGFNIDNFFRIIKLPTDAVSFIITSKQKEEPEETESSISSSSEDEEDESDDADDELFTSSTNWDKIIDKYEVVLSKYIVVMKKTAANDSSATSESITLLAEIVDLAEQLDSAEDEMTSKQLSRYTKLMAKYAEAASKIK